MTILFRAPKETEYTGANTPCRAAASAPTSFHSRQGGPVGWGSTAYVAGSISGGWSSSHPPWWTWTGRATRDTGAVSSVPHPAHANASKQAPPRPESTGIVPRPQRRIHRDLERLVGCFVRITSPPSSSGQQSDPNETASRPEPEARRLRRALRACFWTTFRPNREHDHSLIRGAPHVTLDV